MTAPRTYEELFDGGNREEKLAKAVAVAENAFDYLCWSAKDHRLRIAEISMEQAERLRDQMREALRA